VLFMTSSPDPMVKSFPDRSFCPLMVAVQHIFRCRTSAKRSTHSRYARSASILITREIRIDSAVR